MVSSLSSRRRVVAVLGGGFCGTLTRYGLSTLVQGWLGKGWPYDILLINLTGALLLAGITALADATFLVGPTRRLFLNIGFLGAYTTFSTLALGDVQLFTGGKWLPALLYLMLSLAGGIGAVILGDWLGNQVVKRARYRTQQTRLTRRLTQTLAAQQREEQPMSQNSWEKAEHMRESEQEQARKHLH
jgi:CrcB protein